MAGPFAGLGLSGDQWIADGHKEGRLPAIPCRFGKEHALLPIGEVRRPWEASGRWFFYVRRSADGRIGIIGALRTELVDEVALAGGPLTIERFDRLDQEPVRVTAALIEAKEPLSDGSASLRQGL